MPNPYNNWSRAHWRGQAEGNPYDYEYEPYRAPSGAVYWHTHAYVPDYWKRQNNYGVEGRSNESNYWSFAQFWKQPGPHSGKGPKNYRRSDDAIREEVCERLTSHGQLDASGIAVDVHDAEVTLNGAVDNRRDKRLAEDIVDSVTAVQDVHNRLRIAPSAWEDFGEFGGTAGLERMRVGMEVVGSMGQRIGRVRQVEPDDFLVSQADNGNIRIPYSAVERVTDDRVILKVPGNEVDYQSWE